MHLLVIEDERALCETIVRSLRRLAYSVDYCYDGEKALELLGVERYDLVLLDLNLPGKDGMTVLRTLRQTDRETRVLRQHRTEQRRAIWPKEWYNLCMDKQITLSAFSDELAQVRTKKKEFLTQMDRIIPWGEWIALIRPCYYKGERGNKPYDLERMLRIYMIQNLYNLSDMSTIAEVIDSRAFSDFCGVESSNQVPDGDTLGRFRNLLIQNDLQQRLFAQVVALLTERNLILKKGTIVDSTFIEAPSSTKNKDKKRDPEAHSAKKGNTWHFGYKAHVGVDHETGIVHALEVTSANKHDVCMTAELLTGEEQVVYGDSGYLGAEKRPEAITRNKAGKRIRYKINRRPSQSKHNTNRSRAQIKRREREKSSVRAKVEHVFAVVKQQLRFRKTRYRGLRKQTAKLNMLFALANLILADRPCLAA